MNVWEMVLLTALIVFFIAVVAAGFFIEFDLSFDITGFRYKRIRKNFKKHKDKKSFYKQVRFLKKLLNSKAMCKMLETDLIETKKGRCWLPLATKQIIEQMWDLAISHRQLFSPKEQKGIDLVNKDLEKALSGFKVKITINK